MTVDRAHECVMISMDKLITPHKIVIRWSAWAPKWIYVALIIVIRGRSWGLSYLTRYKIRWLASSSLSRLEAGYFNASATQCFCNQISHLTQCLNRSSTSALSTISLCVCVTCICLRHCPNRCTTDVGTDAQLAWACVPLCHSESAFVEVFLQNAFCCFEGLYFGSIGRRSRAFGILVLSVIFPSKMPQPTLDVYCWNFMEMLELDGNALIQLMETRGISWNLGEYSVSVT